MIESSKLSPRPVETDTSTTRRQHLVEELERLIIDPDRSEPLRDLLEVPSDTTSPEKNVRLRSRLTPEGKTYAKSVFDNLELFLQEHQANQQSSPYTVEEIQAALSQLLSAKVSDHELDNRAHFLIISSVRCRLLRIQRQLAKQDDSQAAASQPLKEATFISVHDQRLTTEDQRNLVFDVVHAEVSRYQHQLDSDSSLETFWDLVALADKVSIPLLLARIETATSHLDVKNIEALLIQSRDLTWPGPSERQDLTKPSHRRANFGYILFERLIQYSRRYSKHHPTPTFTHFAPDQTLPTEPAPNPELETESKQRVPRIPKKLRRAIRIGLLAFTNLAAIAAAPYIVEVGRAVTGSSQPQAAALDAELREEMLGGASESIIVTPHWLDTEEDTSDITTELESSSSPTDRAVGSRLISEESSDVAAQTNTLYAESQAEPQLEPEPELELEPEQPVPDDTNDSPATFISFEPSEPLPTASSVDVTPDAPPPILTPEVSPTETQQTTQNTPVVESTPVPTTEAPPVESISNPIEYFLGGEFNQVKVELRETRLGFRQLEAPPAGYKQVSENNVTFYVPENLAPRFYYLYNPLTVARSLGAFDLPETDRAAFLESRINDNKLTFLIAGLDYRPEYASGDLGFVGRSDAPMILSIDTQTGQVTIVSIARDTWSPEVAQEFGGVRANQEVSVMSWVHQGTNGRLTATDPAFSRYVAENICGCLIDGVLQFNFQAVAEYIDMLYPEGMLILVPETINDTSAFGFYIEAGPQIIDGETAVNYMRTRYASVGGDESRQGRQRQILETIVRGIARDIKQNPLNAPNIIGRFLGITENAFERFDDQRALVDDNDPNEDTNAGMIRGFGITPSQVVRHMDHVIGDITSPAAAGSLVGTFTQGNGQELIDMYGRGEGITTIQIGSNDTNLTEYTSYRNYWQPARQRIGTALGYDLIPGS